MASGKCGKNLTWTLDDEGTLTISGTGRMDKYSLNNPAEWRTLLVKQIIIKNGVISIGRSAFRICTSLAIIKIPERVTTSIGKLLFAGCKSLKKIYYKHGTKIDLHKLMAGNNAKLIPYDELPPVEENLVVYSNTKYDRTENFAPSYSRNWSNVDENTVANRRAAELAAMNIVMNIERNLGFVPVDVSSQNLGYDIKSTSQDGKFSRLIEVKGRYIDAESVTVYPLHGAYFFCGGKL